MTAGQPTAGGRAALLLIAVLVAVAVGVYLNISQGNGYGNGYGNDNGERGGLGPRASGTERGTDNGERGGLGPWASGTERDEKKIPGWLRRDIDLAAQVEKYTSAHGGATDLSAQFFGNEQISAHLHLMAPQQFCPLHHHPEGYELSAIVAGNGFMRGDGPGGLNEEALAPGDVVVSEKGSRHEIGNRDSSQYLAALVLATPRFEGNLYVREGSPQGNGRSTVLPASGQRPDLSKIAFAPWTDVQRHVIKEPVTLPAEGTLILYIRQGEGMLAEPDTDNKVQLTAPQLIVARNAPALLASSTGDPAIEVVALHIAPGQKALP